MTPIELIIIFGPAQSRKTTWVQQWLRDNPGECWLHFVAGEETYLHEARNNGYSVVYEANSLDVVPPDIMELATEVIQFFTDRMPEPYIP